MLKCHLSHASKCSQDIPGQEAGSTRGQTPARPQPRLHVLNASTSINRPAATSSAKQSEASTRKNAQDVCDTASAKARESTKPKIYSIAAARLILLIGAIHDRYEQVHEEPGAGRRQATSHSHLLKSSPSTQVSAHCKPRPRYRPGYLQSTWLQLLTIKHNKSQITLSTSPTVLVSGTDIFPQMKLQMNSGDIASKMRDVL